MSDFHPESQYDGEYDDQEFILWQESDWRKHIQNNACEVNHFARYYANLPHDDRREGIAQMMGWSRLKFPEARFSMFDPNPTVDGYSFELEFSDEVSFENGPYCTPLCNPFYIVACALISYCRMLWERYFISTEVSVPHTLTWNIARHLAKVERDIMASLYGFDVYDYLYTIVQIKYTLQAINSLFTELNQAPFEEKGATEAYLKELRLTLFDLRETCLRVVKDCRSEEESWND